MMHLFTVSVPAFLAHGQLHMVLKTCTASLIMYHEQVTQDCGAANSVLTKLCNAAREAQIMDPRFPNTSPESILDEWSKLVKDDFESRNLETRKANPDALSMADTLNQCLMLLNLLSSDTKELKLQHSELITKIASQKCTISTLQERTASLAAELETANRKLQFICTPERAETPCRKRALHYNSPEHNNTMGVAMPLHASEGSNAATERSSKRWKQSSQVPTPPEALTGEAQEKEAQGLGKGGTSFSIESNVPP